MKGLIVNTSKVMELKRDLSMPVAKQGEVLVAIKSASVNPFDVESAAGRFDSYFQEYGVNWSVQTGLEFAGIVVEDGVMFTKGDKVFGYVHMIIGQKSHAEYMTIDESYLARMPENIDFSQAASLPLGALTSLVALEELGRLQPGGNVLINGASGGLGIQAVQIAKLLGAQVTAIAGPDQRAYLTNYGADDVYDYNQVDILTLRTSFDVIFDLTNRHTLDEMKHLLSAGGVFIPAEPNDENGGTAEDPQVAYLMVAHGDSSKLERIANWVASGEIKAVVDSEFSFDHYQQAISRVQQKGRQGRVVMSW